MRNLLICLGACVVLFAQSSAEEAVKKAEMSWSGAIVSMDNAALEKVLSEDLVYNHSTGVVDTKKSYLESMKSGNLKYLGVDYEETKVRIYGKTAVVNAKVRMKANDKGTVNNNHLLVTHVFVNQKGGWQLVSHQTTRIP